MVSCNLSVDARRLVVANGKISPSFEIEIIRQTGMHRRWVVIPLGVGRDRKQGIDIRGKGTAVDKRPVVVFEHDDKDGVNVMGRRVDCVRCGTAQRSSNS